MTSPVPVDVRELAHSAIFKATEDAWGAPADGFGREILARWADAVLAAVDPVGILKTDWEAFQAELEEARRERDELRKLTETCNCYDGNPANYEGPHPDCMVHGSIRAFHEASADLAAALEQRDDARHDVEELRGQRDFAMRELRAKTEAYDALSTVANTRLVQAVTAEASVERMRPVVEAAKDWRGQYAQVTPEMLTARARVLVAAVDSYEKTQESTDE